VLRIVVRVLAGVVEVAGGGIVLVGGFRRQAGHAMSNHATLLSTPTWPSSFTALGSSSEPMASSMLGSPSSCMKRGVPQSRQKPRATGADERKMPGCPRVQVKLATGTLTSGAPKLPKAFWHMRQWQIEARPSGPSK
jgi:hypothetical protein